MLAGNKTNIISGLMSKVNQVTETANKFDIMSGTENNINADNKTNIISGLMSKVNQVHPQNVKNTFETSGFAKNICSVNPISTNIGMMSSFTSNLISNHSQLSNSIDLVPGIAKHTNLVFPQSLNKISFLPGLVKNANSFIPQSINKILPGQFNNSNSANFQLANKVNPLASGFLGLTSGLLSFYNQEFNNELDVTYITRSKHLNKLLLIFLRLAILLIGGYYSYFLWCTQNIFYLCLLALSFVIFCDSFFISFVRSGLDFKWFSFSYLAFTIQCVIGLWEVSKQNYKNHNVNCANETLTNLTLTFDFTVGKCFIPNISLCAFESIFSYTFLASIIISRRFTSISISPSLHFSLLVRYIAAAIDIIDFAGYSKDQKITTAYGIDLIWGLVMLSTLQFSFVLTSTKSSIDARKKGIKLSLEFLFGTEIWSLFFGFFTHELPYSIARIAFLIQNTEASFSQPTFLIKNLFMVGNATLRIWRTLKQIKIRKELFYNQFKSQPYNDLNQCS